MKEDTLIIEKDGMYAFRDYENNLNIPIEIERLTNIINELEIWLKERLEKLDINGYDDDVFNGIELALHKLQELKGSEMKK